ncbi:hypothetical protein CEXT_329931 [Caerostris extrusa]|uniref:Uncharacterized protein n=1 Tax=Caerostris extrusa TaxID=172846 RepID=A0AAV4SG62_CAEEX|nr:hypothetical protein CEXT_329931 [Caerostris extrusa]
MLFVTPRYTIFPNLLDSLTGPISISRISSDISSIFHYFFCWGGIRIFDIFPEALPIPHPYEIPAVDYSFEIYAFYCFVSWLLINIKC